jgi:hypothetical protein
MYQNSNGKGRRSHLEINGHMKKILKEKKKMLSFCIPNDAKFNKILNSEDSWQKDQFF